MTSYLLLRNNKESGPFSLDELVRQGLKAYDLIWVNGKSAAWRYPGEIQELVQFAPPVEEQPYDRFFKKPAADKKEEVPVIQQQASQPATVKEIIPEEKIEIPVIQETTPIQPQPSFQPKRSVFVTLPGGNMARPEPVKKEVAPQEYSQYQPQEPTPIAKEAPAPAARTITITENPVAAEIKYSQPLDEIKEMYVKTLHERRQRIANKTFLVQALKKVAVVLAIVGAGVLIGISIKSNGGTKLVASSTAPRQELSHQSPSAELGKVIAPTEEEPTVPSEETNVPAYEAPRRPIENPKVSRNTDRTETAPLRERPTHSNTAATTAVPKEDEFIAAEKTPEPPQGVEVNERTGERTRKTRSEQQEENIVTEEPASEPRKEPRAVMSNKGLTSQVSVKTNNYKIVAFGGIRDLQLTLHNDSKYVLDKVLVELQYLKPNLEPFRVDVVTFKSVSPNGSLTIRMPDTNRGIKVKYRILNILSTQSARDMADL